VWSISRMDYGCIMHFCLYFVWKEGVTVECCALVEQSVLTAPPRVWAWMGVLHVRGAYAAPRRRRCSFSLRFCACCALRMHWAVAVAVAGSSSSNSR